MTKGTLRPLTTNSQTTKIVIPKITGTTNLIKRVSEAAEFAKTTFIRQDTSQKTKRKNNQCHDIPIRLSVKRCTNPIKATSEAAIASAAASKADHIWIVCP